MEDVKNKNYSIVSIIVSCIVFGFLFIEFYRPVSSRAIFIFIVCPSVVGFTYSVIGALANRTGLSVVAVILGVIAMSTILAIFLIMLIMGM